MKPIIRPFPGVQRFREAELDEQPASLFLDANQSAPVLAVSVGTDHHPFDRVFDWVQRWVAESGQTWQVRTQYGRTAVPGIGTGQAFYEYAELQYLLAGASIVICHGGPATITEARRAGHLPVVVPRDPRQGEHVDNHQQLFARRLGSASVVRLAETYEAFSVALAQASQTPRMLDGHTASVPPGVPRVGEIIDELLAGA